MYKYKLVNLSDVFKLWKKKFYIFFIALFFIFAIFFIIDSKANTSEYIGKAIISLNYYENGNFDYEQSQKLTSNFNKFSIDKDTIDNLNNLNISLRPIQYSNVLQAICISSNSELAINTANELARLQCEKKIESNIDGVSQKTIFKIVKLADTAEKPDTKISLRNKISLSFLMIALVAIIIIISELLRTNVSTIDEARLISKTNYVVQIFKDKKIDKNSILELKKAINNRKYIIIPICDIKNKEEIENILDNKCAFTENILENANVIDIMRQNDLCILYIQANKVDYRYLQRAIGLIRACNKEIFAIVLE